MANGSAKPILLVLRHHGLGDLITVQPALHGLRHAFPEHRLVATCPSWLVPLAESFGTADQLVSEISSLEPGADARADPTHHRQVDAALLANVLAEIRSADVLVSLRTPGPELIPIINILAPRLLVSYRTDVLPATARFPELDFTDHILVRWRRLLGTIGINPRDEDMYPAWVVPDNCQGFTIVHIGAGSPSRLWPLDRWIEVVSYLRSAGHRIVLTGSWTEAPMVAEVSLRACLPAECDCAGTDIMELTHLVAGACLVVCVDTGISHLATAFRRPAVTLFGPVPPAWWGPPSGNPQHRTLWTGRTGNVYDSVVDQGLLEIGVEDVLGAIDELRGRGMI
jgi:ADP-heptose:LPS heptosyltransferase